MWFQLQRRFCFLPFLYWESLKPYVTTSSSFRNVACCYHHPIAESFQASIHSGNDWSTGMNQNFNTLFRSKMWVNLSQDKSRRVHSRQSSNFATGPCVDNSSVTPRLMLFAFMLHVDHSWRGRHRSSVRTLCQCLLHLCKHCKAEMY